MDGIVPAWICHASTVPLSCFGISCFQFFLCIQWHNLKVAIFVMYAHVLRFQVKPLTEGELRTGRRTSNPPICESTDYRIEATKPPLTSAAALKQPPSSNNEHHLNRKIVKWPSSIVQQLFGIPGEMARFRNVRHMILISNALPSLTNRMAHCKADLWNYECPSVCLSLDYVCMVVGLINIETHRLCIPMCRPNVQRPTMPHNLRFFMVAAT